MMNILVVMQNRENNVMRCIDFTFFECLKQWANVDYCGDGYGPPARASYDVTIVYGIHIGKNFRHVDLTKHKFILMFPIDDEAYIGKVGQWATKLKVQAIVCKFYNFLKDLTDLKVAPVKWLPWSCDSLVFKDYGLVKQYDISMMGTHTSGYPVRQALVPVLAAMPNTYVNGRGRKTIQDTHGVAERTARIFNESKMSVAAGGFWKENWLCIPKYFEIPSCRTVPLYLDAPGVKELFEEGRHYVAFKADLSDFKEKVDYFINHEAERLVIADAAYDNIQERHTHTVRAKELFDFINLLI